MERFEHPPGLDESSLEQLQESDGAAQLDRLVAGVAVHGPHLTQDGLELLQSDSHLAAEAPCVR
ncbi:hypothetical protein ACFV2U_32710 [Streptomyces sp. NPDC059697]|uniref:hypothetical protein n=1 Tax=Streptomyces sp. NPDC059697 TaxID=3346912 RepID=UPI0036B5EBB1